MPNIDLTTLPGWSSLSSGTHNITIVAKAENYRDSEPSAAVSVTKGATLISFTIAGTSYQAEEGMTWEEWVNSSYNTGYQGSGEYLWSCTSSGYIQLDVMYVTTAGTLATRVKTTDIIVKDQSYPVYYD